MAALAFELGGVERRSSFAMLARLGVYSLLLAVFLLAQILQPFIYNTSISFPLFSVLAVAFLSHVITLQFQGDRSEIWFKGLLLLDLVLVTVLLFSTHLNSSLFLFLYFLFILLGGFVFSYTGALYAALAAAIAFSSVSILSPDSESASLLFLVLMNDSAFIIAGVLSGFLSRQIDVTGVALRETDAQLKSVENFNELVLSQMQAGVLVFSKSLNIERSNASAQQLFPQLSGGKERSASLIELLEGYRGLSFLRDLDTWVGESFDLSQFNEDLGTEKVFRGQLSALNDNRLMEPLYILLLQDITKIKRLENDLRQKEKLAAVGGLAAGIAHEIRNPLASISGSIQMLRQSSQSNDDLRLMNIVLKETDRLDHLITEFLDYARPDAPMTDEFSPGSLLHDILQQLGLDQSLDKSVALSLNLESDAKILGSRDKLKQAFLNLIINAYHALEGISQPKLEVSVQKLEEKLVIEIEDNGSGMSDKTKARLFEPFVTTKPKGTGLGLAVTHKILEAHGADIEVHSELGKGTRFSLSFPQLI